MRKIITVLGVIAIGTMLLFARNEDQSLSGQLVGLFKTMGTTASRTISNISNWGYWIFQDGTSAHTPDGDSGGFYPKGTAATVYQDGFVWGGYVGNEIRVGGQVYRIGTTRGWIVTPGTATTLPVAVNPNDARVGIYRLRTDWEDLITIDETTGDTSFAALYADAADIFGLDLGAVTKEEGRFVWEDYKWSWENWPTDVGAPFYDLDDDGVYEPADGETPGIANADQVIWLALNDLDTARTVFMYGSNPVGIELQITMWAYNQPGATLGQILFKKYKMINKSGASFDSVYVAQWSDPDVGAAGDDLCGSDVERSIGFAYSGFVTDEEFAPFDLPPGCVGYDFFQGPMVAGAPEDTAIFDLKKRGGYRNLPMTSFSWFAAGSDISDPTQGEYEGTLEWYNLLRGYTPTDDIANPTPYYVGNDPEKGETKFPLSGDPFRVTGDLDAFGKNFGPGDRRIVLSSGPFNLADGDIQEVVVAVVGGIVREAGGNNRNAVEQMKINDDFAQFIYNNLFKGIPKPPRAPVADVTPLEGEVVLNWGNNPVAYGETEADDPVLGFNFQGYNVYQLPTAVAGKEEATWIATFDVKDNITSIRAKKFLAAVGDIVEVPIQKGTDSGVQRYITIDRDYINERPLYAGSTYYFAVTAYNYNPDPTVPEPSIESALTPIEVVIQPPLPGDEYPTETQADVEVTHAAGTADGSFSVEVISPDQLTGDSYEVYFDQQHFYMDVDGVWKTTNYADSVGKALGKVMDISGSTISAIAYTSPTAGTRDLKFILDLVSPVDGNWAEGIKLTFLPGIVINSASSEDGIASIIDNVENTVLFGSEVKTAADLTGGGVFTGGELFEVNVNTPALPLDVQYIVYDDGWATLYCEDPANAQDCADWGITDAVVVNAEGTCTISEEAYAFKTEKHWNLKNVTTDETLLEDQTVSYGIDLYTGVNVGDAASPIVQGFQISAQIGYAAPPDYTSYTHIRPDETTDVFARSRAAAWLAYDQWGKPYVITSYGMQGWSATSMSIDAAGYGTTDVNYLQRDIEVRFTGEYDTEYTSGAMTVHPVKEGTGSLATIYGARGYDIADHPMNPSPGSSDAFMVRIPFEVWDTENDQQVSIIFLDRMQALEGDFYAFNPSDRMYCEWLVVPYEETVDTPADNATSDYLTWNTVWWNMAWTAGDVVHFLYDNPIQLGVDTWTFETEAPVTGDASLAEVEVEKINVFPNPYYASNPGETNRFDRFVTFNHLPPLSVSETTIRIFNLAGVQVRKFEKDDETQFLKWDLKNESGLPVGSGIYIAYIDMPDLGKQKVLKVFIVQSKQMLQYY